MIAENLYPLLSFVPASVLVAVIKVRRWFRGASGLEAPSPEKSMRSPGDSLRKRIDELDDRLIELTLYALIMPPLLLASYVCLKRTFPGSVEWLWQAGTLALAIGLVALALRFLVLVRKRDYWRMRFLGERMVGQELNKLMLEGCQVYHDFELARDSNLDHIVVAPSGVYAIETKMQRKHSTTGPQKAHEVVHDGAKLQFPDFADTTTLDEAREHANHLSKLLGPELAGQQVKPVVTLPGWYVIEKSGGDVLVLNPQNLDQAILNHQSAALSPDQIMKISRRLEREHREEAL